MCLVHTGMHGEHIMSHDRFAPPAAPTAAAIEKARGVLDLFRQEDSAMPTSYATAFLAVAKEPGMGVSHYARELGMLRPVVSRILLEIGVRARTGGVGMGLVDRVHGSEDLREVNYFLTDKGRKLQADIAAALA